MKIGTREEGDVVIVDIEGRLVRGAGDELLRDTIDELLADGWRKILLNLADVPFIDSSGIGELVAGKRVAEHFGASIKLVELGERIQNTLRLSLILPLFETYETEKSALSAFATD